MKHTRGPWAIDAVMSEALHDIVLDYEIPKAGNPILVASVYGHEEGGRPGDISGLEAEANARLIAAAPDLLSSCEDALHYLPSILEACSADEKGEEWISNMRTAVAKAKGTS